MVSMNPDICFVNLFLGAECIGTRNINRIFFSYHLWGKKKASPDGLAVMYSYV